MLFVLEDFVWKKISGISGYILGKCLVTECWKVLTTGLNSALSLKFMGFFLQVDKLELHGKTYPPVSQ